MSTIHGKSHTGLKFFRKQPAALAVYWIYCSRTNHEGVAWPSLRGLEQSTGWGFNAVGNARHWLTEHQALELVEEYVRPEWRKLNTKEKTQRVNLDRSEYYRPTGYIEVDGKRYSMLYYGAQEASDIDEIPSHDLPHQSWTPSSIDGEVQNLVPVLIQLDTTKDSTAPKNGAVAGASQPAKESTSKERDPWYDVVYDTWAYVGAMNGAMQKMLRGESKTPAFKVGNLPIEVTPDDVRCWSKWYRDTALGGDTTLNMLEDRMKIASSIEYWVTNGKPTPQMLPVFAEVQRKNYGESIYTTDQVLRASMAGMPVQQYVERMKAAQS